ncbi:MAG TPA: peptidyl-prolyl cis-trans isomerase [Armatimonadota bacterium]|nr:peptidyl-prolyl cis-trans isomerase [Armatimonadota bacterium]
MLHGSPRAPRRVKAALFFVASVALASMVVGCGAKPIASVNGQALGEEEFHQLCVTATQINPQQGPVGQQVLTRWIQSAMIAQEAKRLNVYPTEKDLDRRMDAFRKQAAFAGINFEERMQQQGMTMQTLRRELLDSLVTENVQLRGVTVSDEEVRQKFEAQKAQFTQPERIKISQITVDSAAKAKQARTDLDSNTQFALVASTYSQDMFKQEGGKVPLELTRQVQPGMPVDQKIVDAAFKLEPGQLTQPIQVGANWVIARLEEKIPVKQPQLADFEELLRMQARQEKAASGNREDVRKGMQEMVQKAKIEINRPEYQTILKQIQQAGAAAGGPGAAGGPPPGPPGG